MNKIARKLLIVAVMVAVVASLAACNKDTKPTQIDEPVKAQGITLTSTRLLMTKDAQTTLTYTVDPQERKGDVSFETSDEGVAEISSDGVVTAKGTGVATLKVKADDKYAECRVVVGDLIVSKQSEKTAQATDNATEDGDDARQTQDKTTIVGSGNKVYGSLPQGVEHAEAGQTVLIDEGKYDERITLNKNLSLVGINNPSIAGITVTSGKATLVNLAFSATDYPAEGTASVHIKSGASAEITDCFFNIVKEGEPQGGYAVLADKMSGGLKMENNTLSNYRYGIYVCPTDQEITIRQNRLSGISVGIGVDLRQQNTDRDLPTRGSISGNQYNEVERHTQFLHYAETYDGDLDFEDNEEENASNGQSDTGGSGLLE